MVAAAPSPSPLPWPAVGSVASFAICLLTSSSAVSTGTAAVIAAAVADGRLDTDVGLVTEHTDAVSVDAAETLRLVAAVALVAHIVEAVRSTSGTFDSELALAASTAEGAVADMAAAD